MSGWDAPTGNWDSRQGPDESGGPDEQGYQQDEPTGAYRPVRGGEGRLRAGRRGLPGYEQAQDYDQATVEYGQAGYGPGSGYGQQPGYGSGNSPEPGYGSASGASGTGQMVRYGQRSPDEPAFGSAASGPQRPASSGPRDPLGPGRQDPLGSGQQSTLSPGPRRAIGSESSQQPPQVPQASLGSGPQSVAGYGEGGTAAYRHYGADEPTRSGWSDASDQQGYGDRRGYGDRPGYGGGTGYGPPSSSGQGYGQSSFSPGGPNSQPGYGQQGYGQQPPGPGGSFPPGGFGGPGDRGGQDYQTEAYARPGSEPSDYPQDGFGDNSFEQNGFAPDRSSGFGQDPGVTQAYGTQPGYEQNGFAPGTARAPGSPGAQDSQATYPPDGYGQDAYTQGQDAYTQDGYAQDGYDQGGGFGPAGTRQDGYPPDPYSQDGYGPGGYPPEGFGQQGFQQPGDAGYGDDDPTSPGHAPRSRPGSPRSGSRSPQRLGGTRMVLYLAASVVGVAVIVFLVIHLTKSGGGNAAGGSSTPTAKATATRAATGPAAAYTLKLASSVAGKYPLNPQAASALAAAAKDQSAPIVSSLQAKGIGRPGKSMVGIYDLGQVKAITSSAYKGILFVGYDGTFNPASAIKVIRAHLVSPRTVNAGPHGGRMVCGYNTASGADASECVWVTQTTFGLVQFLSGEIAVKYPGAATLTLQVRQAVEVPAS